MPSLYWHLTFRIDISLLGVRMGLGFPVPPLDGTGSGVSFCVFYFSCPDVRCPVNFSGWISGYLKSIFLLPFAPPYSLSCLLSPLWSYFQGGFRGKWCRQTVGLEFNLTMQAEENPRSGKSRWELRSRWNPSNWSTIRIRILQSMSMNAGKVEDAGRKKEIREKTKLPQNS